MRKVGPSFYERVFGGSRFRSLRYMYSSSVIFRECHLYDPKLADGICAPLSTDVSRHRQVISPCLYYSVSSTAWLVGPTEHVAP